MRLWMFLVGDCCRERPWQLLASSSSPGHSWQWPQIYSFPEFLKKSAVLLHTLHWYMKTLLFVFYTLTSLIYFQTLFLPPPVKGNHSKYWMSVLCLYLFLRDVVYYCFLWIYFEFTSMQLNCISFLFLFPSHSALCFLSCLHVPVCTSSTWLSLLTPWGTPTLHPSTLPVTDTQVTSTLCFHK